MRAVSATTSPDRGRRAKLVEPARDRAFKNTVEFMSRSSLAGLAFNGDDARHHRVKVTLEQQYVPIFARTEPDNDKCKHSCTYAASSKPYCSYCQIPRQNRQARADEAEFAYGDLPGANSNTTYAQTRMASACMTKPGWGPSASEKRTFAPAHPPPRPMQPPLSATSDGRLGPLRQALHTGREWPFV